MKRRYNHETKQWDIVLSPYDYSRLIQDLEMLRQQLSRQIQAPRPLGPYEVPNPHLTPTFRKCGNSMCNCTGACFMSQWKTLSITNTNGVN